MNQFFCRCKCCKNEFKSDKQPEDPKNAIGCYLNFCPSCIDQADDYIDVTSYFYPLNDKTISEVKDQLELFGGLNETKYSTFR